MRIFYRSSLSCYLLTTQLFAEHSRFSDFVCLLLSGVLYNFLFSKVRVHSHNLVLRVQKKFCGERETFVRLFAWNVVFAVNDAV